MSLQDYEVAEQTPAPEPESAPDQDNYVVGAVDIIGYTPETFDGDATSGFENTTAAVVGLLPSAVEIVTVDVPDDGRRRLLEDWGGAIRLKFVIKTVDQKIARSVKTLLKSAMRSVKTLGCARWRHGQQVSDKSGR